MLSGVKSEDDKLAEPVSRMADSKDRTSTGHKPNLIINT